MREDGEKRIKNILLLIEESEEAHHFWEEVHEFSWRIVAAVVVLHILGALYNHFIAKNDVLRRMTTGAKQDG